MSCPHPTVAALAGGRCPICAPDKPAAAAYLSPSAASGQPPCGDLAGQARAEPTTPAPVRVEDRVAIARAARAEIERRRARVLRASLASFVRGAWHVRHGAKSLEWGPHLQLVCDTVQAWLEGWLGHHADGRPGVPQHVQDMLYNLAPGTLKSEILMVYGPAWLWLHQPACQFGCVSGNPDNVTRDSNAHRDLVSSAWYRDTFAIEWRVRDDVDAVGKWATTLDGITTLGDRTSRGMSASSVGMHVDILLVDDPDDAHKVHSAAARRDVKSQWSALGSRLNDMTRSLRGVVQQRLHADDLSAELLAAGWPALVVRAQYHAASVRPTPWTQRPDWRSVEGESMHPARLTPGVLAAEKRRLGSAGFAAQYNQDPEPEGGNMLKRAWWRFFRFEDQPAPEGACARPEGCTSDPPVVLRVRRDARGQHAKRRGLPHYDVDKVVITVDATFGSLSDTASRVGLACVLVRGADRFVVDDQTRRMTYPQTEAAIQALVEKWGADQVIIEKKANGAAVIQRLEHEVSGMCPVEPQGGKESRAAAWSPSVEGGNWYLLDGAHWVDHGHDEDDDGFMVEQSTFPNGKRDDRVDMLSQLEAHEREHGGRGGRLKNGWTL